VVGRDVPRAVDRVAERLTGGRHAIGYLLRVPSPDVVGEWVDGKATGCSVSMSGKTAASRTQRLSRTTSG